MKIYYLNMLITKGFFKCIGYTLHFKREDDEVEIRVRLRSRFVAINDIARNYRGGGHLQAAGATL